MKYFGATLGLLVLLACAGEKYYATPEATLERYIENKGMGSAMQVEATMNCFTRDNKEWWLNNSQLICELKNGKFSSMCGESAANKSAIWNDLFEHRGPKSTTVSSTNIDEKEGLATLVVDGVEVYFVYENSNWKLDGFFGVQEELEAQYPQLKGT